VEGLVVGFKIAVGINNLTTAEPRNHRQASGEVCRFDLT
jgi:hypothetical protein